MARSERHEVARWRSRANFYRALAHSFTDPAKRQRISALAEDYERRAAVADPVKGYGPPAGTAD